MLAQIADGREYWGAERIIPRHVHGQAYAALVLSGSYEECGSRGRLCVRPGDVLMHDAFDAHLDRFQRSGAEILNLVMAGPVPEFGIGQVRDADAIVRAAERDHREACALLREQLREASCAQEDWPDALARDLLRDPACNLGDWAGRHGLAPETVARSFHRVFGVTPAHFRLEARTRRALALIPGGDASLAAIAVATGFADQSHMSRAIRALTGAPPRAWRRSNPFKTAGVGTG